VGSHIVEELEYLHHKAARFTCSCTSSLGQMFFLRDSSSSFGSYYSNRPAAYCRSHTPSSARNRVIYTRQFEIALAWKQKNGIRLEGSISYFRGNIQKRDPRYMIVQKSPQAQDKSFRSVHLNQADVSMYKHGQRIT
jgi:hypothetical protein